VDLPYPVAEAVARLMELGHRLVPGSREPVLHRLLVRIFGRTCGHDSGKIRALSRLDGGIEFGEGLERSVAWYLGQAR
jgi:hypothetical protein